MDHQADPEKRLEDMTRLGELCIEVLQQNDEHHSEVPAPGPGPGPCSGLGPGPDAGSGPGPGPNSLTPKHSSFHSEQESLHQIESV